MMSSYQNPGRLTCAHGFGMCRNTLYRKAIPTFNGSGPIPVMSRVACCVNGVYTNQYLSVNASSIMQLVILAAGLGSRFKGNKQTTPIDGHGHFIIDYSIFDAITAGFDSVVFIIRKEYESVFRETIGNRISSNVKVTYVFQEPDTIPDPRIPLDRNKPLGTAHALLCCRDHIYEPFMIINADDYYGRDSYVISARFIRDECDDTRFGCVCYEASKTMPQHGSVKRGICTIEDENIVGILESSIERIRTGEIEARPLTGGDAFRIPDGTPVSMNMFILPKSIFGILEDEFDHFLSTMTDPLKDEFLLPDVISKAVGRGPVALKLIRSSEKWFGVTYPEDKQKVMESIAQKVGNGTYPENLWNRD